MIAAEGKTFITPKSVKTKVDQELTPLGKLSFTNVPLIVSVIFSPDWKVCQGDCPPSLAIVIGFTFTVADKDIPQWFTALK